MTRWTYVDAGDGYLSQKFSLRYSACRGTSDSGLDFTIDGQVHMSDTFLFDSFGRFEGEREISLSGTISWRLGGRTGSCTIDLEPVLTDNVFTSIKGTACGMTLDQPIA